MKTTPRLTTNDLPNLSRRGFLKSSGLAAGIGVSGTFGALLARPASAAHLSFSPDYGPLVEAFDETTGLPLLKLPREFR